MTAGISLVQGKTGAHRAPLQLFLGWATGVLKESGTVSPAPGSRAAVSSSVFSFVSGGVTVTESGIATTATAQSFRVFAEFDSAQSIRTGIELHLPARYPYFPSRETNYRCR